MQTLLTEDMELNFPARLLAEPSRAVTPLAPNDPAQLGYPPTFPIEVALRTAPIRDICEAYGIDEDQWEYLRHEELFLRDLKAAVELVSKEGMSFKLKARLQAEAMLQTIWKLVHDPDTPPNVRAQMIQATARWAGFDQPAATAQVGNGLSININFTGGASPRTIDG
jgi:hypothetical protein